MISVVEINNPFSVFKNMDEVNVHKDIDCSSVLQWLKENKSPTWEKFDIPTLVLVNGEPVLQKDYGNTLQDGDMVSLVVVVQGVVLTIITIIVAIVAIYLALSIDPPVGNNGDQPEADPVYSLSGQKNSVKLGQSIPAHYGAIKNWPDYAALPYNQYEGNNQYQFSLYCVGHGSYNISDIQIEDTPVDNYREVEVAIYEPGQNVSLFAAAVETSSEVGGIELLGENEDDFPGFVGPFITNETQTLTSKIQVDVSLPRGLYSSNDSGGLDNVTVNALFEFQQIDDAGASVGAWQTLANFTAELATTTPQRFTLEQAVAQGRYQVRAKRVGDNNDSHRVGDTIVWEAMRGFLDVEQDFGDVTLMAVKALATSNLNNKSNSRLNIRQVRKLPVWNGSGWSLAETRNPIWAMIDVFKASYGGLLEDSFLDLDGLLLLANEFEASGKWFDWSFANETSVWQAAKTILSVARAIPMLNGSQITAIEDKPRTIKSAMFTPDNMIEGSFKWEISLFKLNEEDSVEVEYLDEETWKPETMVCKIDIDQGTNPRKVKAVGVINRDRAYRYGLYLRAKMLWQREIIKFSTGLEGNIPSVGQLISVSHDVPRWTENTGIVLSVAGDIVMLSEPFIFDPLKQYKIAFRRKDGSASPSYDIIATGDLSTVQVPNMTEDFVRLSSQEKVFYQVGTEEKLEKLCRVKRIKPNQDKQTVEVEAVNEDSRIYSFDAESAPPKGTRYSPPVIPDLPAVGAISVVASPNSLNDILISWPPAVGAQGYIVEISYDDTSWTEIADTVSTQHPATVNSGIVHVRVAAINTGQGSWSTWSGVVGQPTVAPDAVLNLALNSPFVGAYLQVKWDAAYLASDYILRIKKSDDTQVVDIPVTGTSHNYTYQDALIDFSNAPERTMKLSVLSVNAAGTTDATSELQVTNPAPSPATGLQAQIQQNNANSYELRLDWNVHGDADIKDYHLYADTTQGFTPSQSNKVAQTSGNFAIFTVSKTGAPPTIYYRLEVQDVWGESPASSTTAEQSLALP